MLASNKTANVLVIANSFDLPYQEAISGFKASFKELPQTKFTEVALEDIKTRDQEIKRMKPDLIFTLGNESALWVSQQTTSIPIVSTLILKDDNLRKSSNTTGVSLGHSFKTQFEWLKKFFPQKKNVAVLYNPKENSSTIQAVRQIGLEYGFTLVPIPADSPKDLPYALGQLTNNIDILLAIPDETVMSINTAKEVLLASFRNKVPLVGLSDNWVKSGAFYALSWDYEDLGRQCGSMAQRLLNGTRIASVSPEHPRKIIYTINAKIAEHMNIDIPQEVRKNAKKIFY